MWGSKAQRLQQATHQLFLNSSNQLLEGKIVRLVCLIQRIINVGSCCELLNPLGFQPLDQRFTSLVNAERIKPDCL